MVYIISFILLSTWLKCEFLPSIYPFYMFYTAKTFSGKQVRPNFHCLEDTILRHAHMGEHSTAAFPPRTSQP